MSENKTIIVWAGLRVKDGFAEKFKEIAAPVVAATRREKGCLKYDLLSDVSDPDTFYFFEEYESDEAFAAHREMPYMADFRPKRAECVKEFLGVRVMSETYRR